MSFPRRTPRSMQGITLTQVQDRQYRISTASLLRQGPSGKPKKSANDTADTIYTDAIVTEHYPVSRTYHGILIGKGGSRLKQLRIETGTRLDVNSETESVMIRGTQDNVDRAKEAIDNAVKEKLQKTRPTHFLSLPLTSAYTIRKLQEFSSSLLTSSFKCEGVDSSIMISPANLHITLGVLKLLSQKDIESAVRFLKESVPPALDEILLQQPSISLRLRKLAVMQLDPAEAHVLYIEAQDDSKNGTLKKLCTTVIDKMVDAGYLERENRPLKIHVTLMNTSHRPKSAEDDKRQAFDARPILASFGDLDLGLVPVDKLHLMKMGMTGRNKTYESEGFIRLDSSLSS